MPSIYDVVPDWVDNRSYEVNDIYRYQNVVRYCKVAHSVAAAAPFDSTKWDGFTTENGIIVPRFFWAPSWQNDAEFEPRVKTIEFGGGYEQRVSDDINNTLFRGDLKFEKRSDKEALAINHFFYSRRGVEYFLFTPYPPFNSQKRFKCPRWNSNNVFAGYNDIVANFQEVPA